MSKRTRTPVEERRRGAHWFAGRVHDVLDGVGEAPGLLSLDAAETGETVLDLVRAAERLTGLALAALARADDLDVAATSGATSTQAWLAHAANLPPKTAHRLLKQAHRLDSPYAATADALVAGDVDSEQAAVIVKACDALPADSGPEILAKAEAHLLSEARQFDAQRLAVLGKRVLAVVDPDAADRKLGRQLEDEERQARRRTHFTIRDNGDGTCTGDFRIPALHGAMLSKALHALASPKRPDAIARQVEQTMPDGTTRLVQRVSSAILGEAFTHYIERFPTTKLQHGGVDATVVVTLDLETLLRGLGVAGLDTGGHISAAEARRLACEAGIIPAVLGGRSRVLDLGRRRYFNKAQRLALGLRDRTCTVDNCDRPAAWCHAHHDFPWSRGGPTTLDNGRLLCPRHHTLVHHPDYKVTKLGDGRIGLTRQRT